MKLRPYQREAIDAVWAWMRANAGNPCVVLPTGAGKTVVMAEMIREALTQWPGTRICVLAHVRELVAQNAEKLAIHWPGAPIGVYSASLRRRDRFEPVIFASIQSVAGKALQLGRFDMLLIDECFPAGTLIATPHGPVPIERLKPGDAVLNAFGSGPVRDVFKSNSTNLVDVELTDGTSIICTAGHPFFTDLGWRPAASLVEGAAVYRNEDLRALRKCVSTMGEASGRRNGDLVLQRESMEEAGMLLSILRQEIQESDEQERRAREDEGATQRNPAQANPHRRQWATAPASAFGFVARIGRWLVRGASGSDKNCERERVSNLLQDGYRKPIADDQHRDRRSKPHWQHGSNRCKEIGDCFQLRVARVSRVERESATPVFNLHVGGHPSYFAHGVLVHNCHRIPLKTEGQYREFIAECLRINPHLRVCGLTATPYRLGGGPVCDPAHILHEVVYDANVGDLIREGFLCRLVSKSGATRADISGVHIRQGEYIARELEAAVDTSDVVEAACDEIVSLCHDRRAWVVFCAGVKHARHVTEALTSRGVSCAMVDGKTPAKDRDAHIRAFQAGRLRALVNVNVLSEGFDAQHVDAVILMRPTKSAGLFYQQCGRGLRLHPHKTNTLVLDFAGNVLEHGPIDAIRPPKRPGEKASRGAPVRECPECRTLTPIQAQECPECGYQWPEPERIPAHFGTAFDAPILSEQQADTWFDVSHVYYTRHEGKSGVPTLRTTYQCGLRTFREWVCLEHSGYAREKAVLWWIKRSALPIPRTVDEARANSHALAAPSRIQVRERGKYPEILRHEFNPDTNGQGTDAQHVA